MTTEFLNTPEQEITNRIFCLKQKMEDTNTQALFLTHKPDIFYFSGTAQDCYLYISLDHEPLLFAKRYFPRAKLELVILIQLLSVLSIASASGASACPLFNTPMLSMAVSPGSRKPLPFPPALSSIVISPASRTGAFSVILNSVVQFSFPSPVISMLKSSIC